MSAAMLRISATITTVITRTNGPRARMLVLRGRRSREPEPDPPGAGTSTKDESAWPLTLFFHFDCSGEFAAHGDAAGRVIRLRSIKFQELPPHDYLHGAAGPIEAGHHIRRLKMNVRALQKNAVDR